MKTLLLFTIAFISTLSCTKPSLVTEKITPALPNDLYLQVSSFKAEQTGERINITFTTVLENNLKELVLMHGSNSTQLCRAKSIETDGNSISNRTYVTTDENPQGRTTYYVIKYITKSGEWGCSDLYRSSHR